MSVTPDRAREIRAQYQASLPRPSDALGDESIFMTEQERDEVRRWMTSEHNIRHLVFGDVVFFVSRGELDLAEAAR